MRRYDTLSHFDRTTACDRQTDRQTDGQTHDHSICRDRIAPRGNKV